MWCLLEISTMKRFYLVPSRGYYKAGRLNTCISLSADSSVSRFHATFYIFTDSQGYTQCEIEDCSENGTFVSDNCGARKRLPKGKRVKLKHNDHIRFGIHKCLLQITHYKYNIVVSALSIEEKAMMCIIVQFMGCKLKDIFTVEDCEYTHLTLKTISFTIKLLHALVTQKEIVLFSYWLDLFKIIRPELTCNVPLPDIKDYRPIYSTFDMRPVPQRRTIFVGLEFVFLNQDHAEMYGTLIELAGGSYKCSIESIDYDYLLKKNVLAIQYFGPSQSQNYQTEVKVSEFLTKHSKRIIPEYEIGLAILSYSIELYCNSYCKAKSLDEISLLINSGMFTGDDSTNNIQELVSDSSTLNNGSRSNPSINSNNNNTNSMPQIYLSDTPSENINHGTKRRSNTLNCHQGESDRNDSSSNSNPAKKMCMSTYGSKNVREGLNQSKTKNHDTIDVSVFANEHSYCVINDSEAVNNVQNTSPSTLLTEKKADKPNTENESQNTIEDYSKKVECNTTSAKTIQKCPDVGKNAHDPEHTNNVKSDNMELNLCIEDIDKKIADCSISNKNIQPIIRIRKLPNKDKSQSNNTEDKIINTNSENTPSIDAKPINKLSLSRYKDGKQNNCISASKNMAKSHISEECASSKILEDKLTSDSSSTGDDIEKHVSPCKKVCKPKDIQEISGIEENLSKNKPTDIPEISGIEENISKNKPTDIPEISGIEENISKNKLQVEKDNYNEVEKYLEGFTCTKKNEKTKEDTLINQQKNTGIVKSSKALTDESSKNDYLKTLTEENDEESDNDLFAFGEAKKITQTKKDTRSLAITDVDDAEDNDLFNFKNTKSKKEEGTAKQEVKKATQTDGSANVKHSKDTMSSVASDNNDNDDGLFNFDDVKAKINEVPCFQDNKKLTQTDQGENRKHNKDSNTSEIEERYTIINESIFHNRRRPTTKLSRYTDDDTPWLCTKSSASKQPYSYTAESESKMRVELMKDITDKEDQNTNHDDSDGDTRDVSWDPSLYRMRVITYDEVKPKTENHTKEPSTYISTSRSFKSLQSADQSACKVVNFKKFIRAQHKFRRCEK